MRFFCPVVCAAAAFAGWMATAIYRESWNTDTKHRSRIASANVFPDAAVSSLHSLRRPAATSAEITRIAALATTGPDDESNELVDAVQAWLPGTARDFALVLLSLRAESLRENPASARSTPLAGDDAPSNNATRELAESMAGDFDPAQHNNWGDTLSEWMSHDPSAARAAVLAIPPGESRAAAVDAATVALVKTDSAAALEFFLQSGEQKPQTGAALAWVAAATFDLSPGGIAKSRAARQFLDRLSPSQQDELFASLATAMEAHSRGMLREECIRDANLKDLAEWVVHGSRASGPGTEALFRHLSHSGGAESVRELLSQAILFKPELQKSLDILSAAQVEESVGSGDAAARFLSGDWQDFLPPGTKVDPNEIVERNAPEMLSSLVRTGRLTDALKVLDRIKDPSAWSNSFQTVLPAWMDTDPAAARAAFNAAPLTALERERLQRHPAFLLHPQP